MPKNQFPAANSVPVDDYPLEDVLEGRGIGSLSLENQTKSGPNLMEILEDRSLFPPDIFRRQPDNPRPFDWGTGPCLICNGPHGKAFCGWQYHCPFDAKVGKNFKVICSCSEDVIDGKCAKRCGNTFGLAVHKNYKTLYTSALAKRGRTRRTKMGESPSGRS